MDDLTNNYVVGRGRLFFGQFAKGTRRPQGQLYFGNTPELSLSQNEDTLDHYSSEGGVRVKDASVSLQTDSSGTFKCDNISDTNLALWFRGLVASRIEAGSARASGTITFSTAVPAEGDKVTINGHDIIFKAVPGPNDVLIGATLAETATNLSNHVNNSSTLLGVTATHAAAVVTLKAVEAGSDGNDITVAKTAATPANITVSAATLTGGADVTETSALYRGRWHQLGVDSDTPQGVRNVGSVAITGVDAGSFTVEEATGRLYINSDADDVVDGTEYDITFGVAPAVEDVVIGKGEVIEGEMQFIANNAAGENKDYFWPYVKLTPDGDFSLKGDTWQEMSFGMEILKRDALTERQYITTRR